MNNLLKLINYQDIEKILNNYNLDELELIKPDKENIKLYLNNCLEILKKNDKIYNGIYFESKNYIKTKYHSENLITHLYSVGYLCSIFAQKFNLDQEFAFKLGFFHDIGKPWAKKIISNKKKKIHIHTGHAQVGENICNYLNLDDEICWTTSFHMCSCSHNKSLIDNFEYISSLKYISFDEKQDIQKYINSYACLTLSDTLGRLGDYELTKNLINSYNHSVKWLEKINNDLINKHINYIENGVLKLSKIYPNNSIIILTLGHSGFGKSTFAKNIIDYCKINNITVSYAERDLSYYETYSLKNNLSIEESLQVDYKIVYSFIEKNDLKKEVQSNWVNKLNKVLDMNTSIKIIDSVQVMYPHAWKSTIESLSEDAKSIYLKNLKIGYYGFPMSLYDIEYVSKTGSYEIIPRPDNDGYTYPNLNSEVDNKLINLENIDIGYGNIKYILNSMINYLKYYKMDINYNQIHIIEILNKEKLKNKDELINKIVDSFPKNIINTSIDVNYYNLFLIRFHYKDGMQIFNGPSRDYRGESLLFNDKTKNYYIGRASLPVFVDYENIRNDIIALNMIKEENKFHILPKFDGSLFVLTFIKKNTEEYNLLKQLINFVDENSYIDNYRGLWCFGSKSLMFAKNQNGITGILSRIHNSIENSYQDKYMFIEKCYKELDNKKLLNYDNISLCFESIDENPSSELTVKYDKSFCPFLCFVLMKDFKKKIILPDNLKYLNPYAKVNTFNNWEDVLKFKEEGHNNLLNGCLEEEPEGYVVWINNSNIGIKLKHFEYYAAHKPYKEKNLKMCNEIQSLEKYKKLKERLIKFKDKPKLDNILENLNPIIDKLKENKLMINTKKSWALYWREKENITLILKEFIETNKIINNNYPQLKDKLLNKQYGIIMYYYDDDFTNNEYINNIVNKFLIR